MLIAQHAATLLQSLKRQRMCLGRGTAHAQQCAQVADRADRVGMVCAQNAAAQGQCLPPVRLGFFQLALVTQQAAEVVQRLHGVWMFSAEIAPVLQQRFVVQRPRFVQAATQMQQQSQVVDGINGARVVLSEHLAAQLERLLQQRLGLLKLTLVLQQRAQLVDRLQSVRVLRTEQTAPQFQRLVLWGRRTFVQTQFAQRAGHGLQQPRPDLRLLCKIRLDCLQSALEDVLVEVLQGHIGEVHLGQLGFERCRSGSHRRLIHGLCRHGSVLLVEDVGQQALAHQLRINLRQLAGLECADQFQLGQRLVGTLRLPGDAR